MVDHQSAATGLARASLESPPAQVPCGLGCSGSNCGKYGEARTAKGMLVELIATATCRKRSCGKQLEDVVRAHGGRVRNAGLMVLTVVLHTASALMWRPE